MQMYFNLSLNKDALREHIASDDYKFNLKTRQNLETAIIKYEYQLDLLENPRTDSSNWFSWVTNSWRGIVNLISKFFGG